MSERYRVANFASTVGKPWHVFDGELLLCSCATSSNANRVAAAMNASVITSRQDHAILVMRRALVDISNCANTIERDTLKRLADGALAHVPTIASAGVTAEVASRAGMDDEGRSSCLAAELDAQQGGV